jgi:hypothetical protein
VKSCCCDSCRARGILSIIRERVRTIDKATLANEQNAAETTRDLLFMVGTLSEIAGDTLPPCSTNAVTQPQVEESTMSDLLQRLFAFIVAKLIGDKTLLWAMIEKSLGVFKDLAAATETVLDDLFVQVLDAAVTDEEVRALVNAILDRLLTLTQSDVPRGSVADDPQIMAHTKVLAGKLNIDWKKLIELLMQLLPFIIPFLKPEPTA